MIKPATGRIFGALGLVFLAWSGVIWMMFSSKWLVLGHISVAVACFLLFALTNFAQLGEFASSRGTIFLLITGVGTIILLAGIVFANYIAIKKKDLVWDVTKNKLHTLAPDTTKTLAGLKENVKVLAFFTGGEPGMEQAQSLINKYTRETDKLKVEWVDPAKEPALVKKYGVRKEGGHRIVVLFPAPGEGEHRTPTEQRVNEISEEALTNAIVKATHQSEKKVYFVTGHGEDDLEDTKEGGFSELKKKMDNEGLKPTKLNLASTAEIAQDAGAVVLAGPAVDLATTEVETLRKYLGAGGRLIVMVEPMTATPNLNSLLKEWAVEPDDAMIVDPLSKMFGAGATSPVVQEYGDSDITKDFRLNTVFPTARPLTILHDVAGVTAKPLALTLPTSWGEKHIDQQPVRHDEDEKGGPLPVAVVVTKDAKAAPAKRSDEGRLIVFGDRDFPTNQFRLAFGNEDFFLNCMNWLVEQTDRITIRPRMRDASRLFLTEAQSTLIFVGAIEVPVLILVAGLWVWMSRRSR